MREIPFPGWENSARSLYVQEPQTAVRGVVLVLHGMAEHAARYHLLAGHLADCGYVVAVYNHLGHGPETPKDQLGYFADKYGWQLLVEDAERVRGYLAETYPNVPFILLGHSMGSFVARGYAIQYPDGLDALVLSSTGWHPRATCLLGGTLARVACVLGKGKQPARLLHNMAFSANNKGITPLRTDMDWLSRDEKEVDAYVADPLCGFPMTNAGYRDLFDGLLELTHVDRLAVLSKDLPVLVISGRDDAVGGGGTGPATIARQYRDAGLTDVQLQLYDGARHELLHELNRVQVTMDLMDWLDRATSRSKGRKRHV